MNIGVSLPGPVSNSLGYILKSRIAESHGALIFYCLRACCPVTHSVSHTFKVPSQVPGILRAVTQDFKAALFFLFSAHVAASAAPLTRAEVSSVLRASWHLPPPIFRGLVLSAPYGVYLVIDEAAPNVTDGGCLDSLVKRR